MSNTYCVPGTVLGTGDRVVSTTDLVLALRKLTVWWERQTLRCSFTNYHVITTHINKHLDLTTLKLNS